MTSDIPERRERAVGVTASDPTVEPHVDLLAKAAHIWKPSDAREYFELRRLLRGRGAVDRAEFKRRFSNYYRLHTGGLTDDFKKRYFELLFAYKVPRGDADPYTSLLLELYKFPRRQGKPALQASFVSKLVAIHDESRPIHDVHVSRFFGLAPPALGSVRFRIAGFVANLEHIRERYDQWSGDPRVREIVGPLLEQDQELRNCHWSRVCDFLVWTVGAHKIT